MSPNQYDLERLWDEHLACEFTDRDADETVATMVDLPYVNHIPTMTGGRGKIELRDFYRDHFISKLPADTRTVTISRTVGESRLVEELVFCFTHDTEIDFLLPGIAPTGKYVEVPTVAVVDFVDGKIASEHIYWDQACVLVQIGLLNPEGLPVCGVESARKAVDRTLPFRAL